jgi:hypothetical protein
MYELCRELDPTRPVVDNSACTHAWGPNIHVRTDIDDFHFYTNIPDQASAWEAMIEQFNMRPLWTFSGHGDSQRTGHEPLVLSEFGNWGLPLLKNLRAAHGGEDPPWFGIGPWWSSWEGEPGWPAGADERFARLGLDKIWESYDAFAEATQWHQYAAMKFEIEAMRRQPDIAGYVITELADIYWESNGLLDFYRHPKAYHSLFSTINAPDVVVARVGSHALWDDEQLTARLHASRYGHEGWEGARLRWSLAGEAGEWQLPPLARGETVDLGEHTWGPPRVNEAGNMQVHLSVLSAGGARLAANSLDLAVYPSGLRQAGLEATVVVPDQGAEESNPLRRAIEALGYATTERLAGGKVAVAGHATPELLRWVREGGDLLYISRGPGPFFWTQGRGGAYSGGWLTSFSWVRPDVHKRLKVDNPLGLAYRRVMPTRTILGLPVEDPAVQGDILAGMVSGWVGHPAVHTLRFRYGKGRVVMTTFDLHDNLDKDPVAATMFHDLLAHLVSDACRPTLKANY